MRFEYVLNFVFGDGAMDVSLWVLYIWQQIDFRGTFTQLSLSVSLTISLLISFFQFVLISFSVSPDISRSLFQSLYLFQSFSQSLSRSLLNLFSKFLPQSLLISLSLSLTHIMYMYSCIKKQNVLGALPCPTALITPPDTVHTFPQPPGAKTHGPIEPLLSLKYRTPLGCLIIYV